MKMDRHHTIFTARTWSVYREGEALRESPSLIATMPVDLHRELHRNCPPVPVPSHHALQFIISRFEPVRGDVLASMDNLMLTIEESTKRPRMHHIERALAELTIWGLEAQKPYLEQI